MHKKRRPTLEDALDFLRDGTFSVQRTDFVSWDERAKELSECQNAVEALLKAHLAKSRNLVLVVLTCHIIVEFMLNKFIEFAAMAQTDISRERFSFAQKILLLHMFGFSPHPTVIPSLELLNRIRNQVAHTLDLDRKKIDLLILINDAAPENDREMDDRQRVSAIKRLTALMCGHLNGFIEGMSAVRLMDREALGKDPSPKDVG